MSEGRVAMICCVSKETVMRLLASSLELILLHQMPVVGGRALLEQVGEGGAGVALRIVAKFVKLGESGVVGLDRRVGRFEREEAHRVFSPMYAFGHSSREGS